MAVLSLLALRYFLTGQLFVVLANYARFHWLHTIEESALLYRWHVGHEGLQHAVLHHPGKAQGQVDGLSRLSESVDLTALDPITLDELHGLDPPSPSKTRFVTIDGLTATSWEQSTSWSPLCTAYHAYCSPHWTCTLMCLLNPELLLGMVQLPWIVSWLETAVRCEKIILLQNANGGLTEVRFP